jgi:hypothetical protein
MPSEATRAKELAGLRLTKLQWHRLREIGSVKLSDSAPWWSSATDKSLLRRGLIERCDETRKLSSSVSFTTYLCRLTDAGRSALAGEDVQG